ncbi:CytochromB561_N domain-containing protein [Cephalotus follicularis]|uniref:CytochromB561_N domain-containing protein n=1 Tax=Cephalotus follicularis TaxID=3775 RepID=A0A1Q3B227_CEPFO|nr:CytochromB561_N domain-containing protein [Cephalotus follicularis]
MINKSGGAGRDKGSGPPKASKFEVYQNPTLSSALTASSLKPSNSTILFILFISSASALALLSLFSRENGLLDKLRLGNVPQNAAYLIVKAIQTIVGLVFVGAIFSLFKFISLIIARNSIPVQIISSFKATKDQPLLTNRQLGLLGLKPKIEQVAPDSSKKPPKSKTPSMTSPSDVLVPLHQPITNSNRKPQSGSDKPNISGGGTKINTFSTPSKSQGSPSLYLVPATTSLTSSVHSSPMNDRVSSPWLHKRVFLNKEITTEEQFEQFLAEVDEKITESAGKLATPPPTIGGFGIASPITVASSANSSGTTRNTPLRPVRMSPGSQKFKTPPKKGEGDLPPPMSIEDSIAAFEHLGIYPQIEQWRDCLRQWFSSVLLKPLLNKIETSHIQVMQAAAKLGILVTINQVGSDITGGSSATVFPVDRTKDWQPAFTLDEDALLHQIRATLVQALEASLPNMQQSPLQNSMIPMMQECVDAITEHQRLHALMKGEWVKGLLPQSSVRADYSVERIRELAEGTCLRNYEYLGSGEVYDKKNKKWTLELPTDAHLLLYLFCAFLEHPKWMLHVDPTSYTGAQSSKNPLFLGVLPPKERFPEKYIAVISSVPSTLHPEACVLVAGKQSPPIFSMYWDKNLQFSLQGRTALWDSILLLCHRIKVGYGGIIRGMHLGSSALNILSVLDSEPERLIAC